jgi:hypothetical protein
MDVSEESDNENSEELEKKKEQDAALSLMALPISLVSPLDRIIAFIKEYETKLQISVFNSDIHDKNKHHLLNAALGSTHLNTIAAAYLYYFFGSIIFTKKYKKKDFIQTTNIEHCTINKCAKVFKSLDKGSQTN